MPDQQDRRHGTAGHRTGPDPGLATHPTGLRSHQDLRAENRGLVPWCGPATLALASGLTYAETGARLRAVAPGWYPAEGPVVTAYWRDLLAVLDQLGIPHRPVPLPDRRPSLLGLVRDGLAEGWYLLRVTDHFLLLRSHGFGLATLHDNRHTATVVGHRSFGRRRVTHAAWLPTGPALAG